MKKMSFAKRFGYFWLSIVPFLAYLAVITAVSVVFSVLFIAQGMSMGTEDLMSFVMEQITAYTMEIGVIYAVIAIVGLGLWYFFGCKRKKLLPPKGVFTISNLIIWFLLAIGMQFIVSLLMGIVGGFLPTAMENYMEMVEMSGIGEITVAGILYAVILGPIAEELTFRGLTLYYAQKFTKHFWIANVFQAALFGIFHGNRGRSGCILLRHDRIGCCYGNFGL